MPATLGYGKIGTLCIPAGESRTLTSWSRHPKRPRYWAQPKAVEGGRVHSAAISCEVTKVEVSTQPGDGVVAVTVKNTGFVDWGFELHQSFLLD